MVLDVFIALPGCRLWCTGLPFVEALYLRRERECEDTEFDGRRGHVMAKLEEGLIYRRIAGTQVSLTRDPEVDTQKHG
jgi:hypothetical protein